MSDPYNRVFHELAKIERQQNNLSHQADDFGWPLCKCESCQVIRDRMDALHIDAILSGYDQIADALPVMMDAPSIVPDDVTSPAASERHNVGLSNLSGRSDKNEP